MAFQAFRIVGSVAGVDQTAAAFTAAAQVSAARVRVYLRTAAEEIRTESLRLVPVDTGRLKGTAFVRQVDADTVEVGYGTNYALYVHEIPPPGGDTGGLSPLRPTTRTARHRPPTQWKFLEVPARARIDRLPGEFARLDLFVGVNWSRV